MTKKISKINKQELTFAERLADLQQKLSPENFVHVKKVLEKSEENRIWREANPIVISEASKQRIEEWNAKQAYEDAQIKSWMSELSKARKKYSSAKKEYRKEKYEALSNAYRIYRTAENESYADLFYHNVASILKKAGLKIQSNTPGASLVIRYIWGNLSASNVFKYGCALKAAKEANVAIEEFTDWISKVTITGAVELTQAEIDEKDSYKERLNRARALVLRYFEIREVSPYAIVPMLHSHKVEQMLSVKNDLCVMLGTAYRRMDRESDYSDLHISVVLPPNLDIDILIVDRFAKIIAKDIDRFEAELSTKEEQLWANELQARLWQAEFDEAEKVRQYWANRNQATLYEDQYEFAKAMKTSKNSKK
jgi:hypothetical protein